jgi:hypothetical protein
MDVIAARTDVGFWDPAAGDDERAACSGFEVPDALVDPALPAFAPERFVPLDAVSGSCPPSVESYAAPDRPLAASRLSLAAAWTRLADGIVVITLREAANRRAHFAQELRAVGIAPENADRTYWYISDRPRADFEGKRGRFGCMRSHIAVTVEAERRGWRRWVVFEDDGMFLPTMSAGLLHHAADALDADPGMAVLGLGSTATICDNDGPHGARHIFPVRVAGGTTCFVATPAMTDRLRAARDLYGDPAERGEGIPGLTHEQSAADAVIYNTDLLKRGAGVYHALPNAVTQRAAATQIGYQGTDIASVGSWAVRTFGLEPVVRDAADPRIRQAAKVSAAVAATATAAAIALGAAAVVGIARHRKRGRGGALR